MEIDVVDCSDEKVLWLVKGCLGSWMVFTYNGGGENSGQGGVSEG